MNTKKRIFAVESIVTFFEVSLVEAENEEQAEKIAAHSDYNTSRHIGTQTVNVYKVKDRELKRFKQTDQYFFDGYAFVDDESYLCYNRMDGTLNGRMPITKVEL